MAKPEQARKWRETHPHYRKDWYRENKERVRQTVKQKYYESVTLRRIEDNKHTNISNRKTNM